MNNHEEPMLLSESDKGLVDLVSRGLTDDEITAQLEIPKRQVLHSIARLLAKLGAQERLEIVFYAYTDRGMYKRVSTEVEKDFQVPTIKQKAS